MYIVGALLLATGLTLFPLAVAGAVIGIRALLLGRMPGTWLPRHVRQPRLWGLGVVLVISCVGIHSVSLLAIGIGLVVLGHVVKSR